MTTRKITFEVDTTMFFDAVAKLDRATVGDRFIELVLSTGSVSTRIALLALYGINVLSATEDPPARGETKEG